jgi:hypothetical protein
MLLDEIMLRGRDDDDILGPGHPPGQIDNVINDLTIAQRLQHQRGVRTSDVF